MKKLLALLLALLLTLSLFACNKTETPPADVSTDSTPDTGTDMDTDAASDVVTLDFYANTDFLGNLQSSDTTSGAAILAAKIRELRAENPDGSAFFCVGDALSGTPIAALVNGISVIEVLNAIPYDTFTLGNHEFDWGPDVLTESMKSFDFPVLCANITYSDSGQLLDGAIPYVILEKNGVKIGVLGLTTEATPSIIRANYAEAICVEDTTACAARYVPEIREKGADLVIIAGHLPLYEGENGAPYTGELYDIAMNVEGIDAIFGGHNDTLNAAELINGIPVAKSAFYGNELSHIRITYDRTSDTVISATCDTIDVLGDTSLMPEADVETIVADYALEADRLFDVEIGYASADIEMDYFYECAITNWFTTAIVDATGADMAFVNPSGVFESVSEGPISLRKIYQMSPFENELVLANISGAELRTLWETTLETERMPQYGTLAFAGLCITYDSTLPDGQKVLSLTLPDGTPIGDEDVFCVATLDFLAAGGNDYTILAGMEWESTAIMMRDAYAVYLGKIGTLTPETVGWMEDISR